MALTSVRPVPANRVSGWGAETDVLVVGNGAAGAGVLVVDAAGGWGGATATAGGSRYLGGVPAWGYRSGTSLGDSTFFGRRAGRSAATPAHGG